MKLEAIRSLLIEYVEDYQPVQTSSLLTFLVFGNALFRDKRLEYRIKTIGMSHILSASGFNISLLNSALQALSEFFHLEDNRFYQSLYDLFSIICLSFYTIFAGASLPLIRALVMAIFDIIRRLMGRRTSSLFILCLVFVIFLMCSKFNIFSASFFYTFIATLVIISSGQECPNDINDGFSRENPLTWIIHGIKTYVINSFLLSIRIQFFLLPLEIYFFNSVTLLGLLANILFLWLVPFFTYAGFLEYLIGAASLVLRMNLGLFITGVSLLILPFVELFTRVSVLLMLLPIQSIKVDEAIKTHTLLIWFLIFVIYLFFRFGLSSRRLLKRHDYL